MLSAAVTQANQPDIDSDGVLFGGRCVVGGQLIPMNAVTNIVLTHRTYLCLCTVDWQLLASTLPPLSAWLQQAPTFSGPPAKGPDSKASEAPPGPALQLTLTDALCRLLTLLRRTPVRCSSHSTRPCPGGGSGAS